MANLKRARPTKDACYLDIAEKVALRSTCHRRKYGAVIVNKDEVLATGYGGPPRKTINCNRLKFCYRSIYGARRGENYELCRAVHAEMNAIIQARRLDMIGSTLYLVGLDSETKERLFDAQPCRLCRRAIVNAGIKRVVVGISKEKTRRYNVKEWVKNSLWEIRKEKGHLIPIEPPITLSDPIDEEKRSKLMERFPALNDAVVVQTTSYEDPKQTIGRAAARFVRSNVKSGNSVSLSCGDTIHAMIEAIPYQSHRMLTINQLSVEGDPTTIHQAPATLVGLLRGKCSAESHVYGLHLPPPALSQLSINFRREFANSRLLIDLKKRVRRSDYLFIGVGSADRNSSSFWRVAEAATRGKFPLYLNRLGIVGEINNQIFDKSGNDCTHKVPGLSDHVINILSLNDIRTIAHNYPKQKVVMIATGEGKTRAIRAALDAGFANILITGRNDVDRILSD